MGVTVRFLEKAATQDAEPRRGVRVPASAIVQRDGTDQVFVVGGDNALELRAVQAGATLADDREITSGLAPGETVVANPSAELAAGTTISTDTE